MYLDLKSLNEVKNWVGGNKTKFTPNGYARSFYIFNKDDLPSFIQQIKNKIEAHYKIDKEAQQEPLYKDFIGYITDGGQIHKHKDL